MICPYCNREAEWVENKAVYGKNVGKSVMMWLCRPCDARVGCHQNTRRPLGTLANRELREWRMRAHLMVDPLWKTGRYKRGAVYARLADAFGREIHMGEADIRTCQEVIRTVPLIFQKQNV